MSTMIIFELGDEFFDQWLKTKKHDTTIERTLLSQKILSDSISGTVFVREWTDLRMRFEKFFAGRTEV